jgi:hypothetical protein
VQGEACATFDAQPQPKPPPTCPSGTTAQGDSCVASATTTPPEKPPQAAASSQKEDANAKHPGQSKEGPLYVELTELGLNFLHFPGNQFVVPSASWAGFRAEVEVGYHFSARHDGLVVALRQSFIGTMLRSFGGGTTSVRVGYDIPIALGTMELNLDPFGSLGIGYIFQGPNAGVMLTAGIDAKLFVAHGYYVFARPLEIGAQCFETSGDCFLLLALGAGGGLSF